MNRKIYLIAIIGLLISSSFNIASAIAPPYEATRPIPRNNETNVSPSPTLSVYLHDPPDPDGEVVQVYFVDASNNEIFAHVKDVKQGGRVKATWNDAKKPGETYRWYVIVVDSWLMHSKSDVWTFKVDSNPGIIVEKFVKRQSDDEWKKNADVSVNDFVEFMLVLKNTGDTVISSASLVDYLPVALEFNGNATMPPDCIKEGSYHGGNEYIGIYWNFSNINPQESIEIILTAKAIEIGSYPCIAKVFAVDIFNQEIRDSDQVDVRINEINDEIPPETHIKLEGENGNNGWYVSKIAVKLDATDDETGVKETWYAIDRGSFILYEKSFILEEEGNRVINYYSIDESGNVEETKTTEIHIDRTLPSTEYIIYGEKINENTYENSVKVELIANDDVSGVNFIMYRILNSENDEGLKFSVYDKEFVLDEPGKNTVEFYSTDKAGNKEERKSFTIIIEDGTEDNVPPDPLWIKTEDGPNGKPGDTMTFTSKVYDPNGDKIRYQFKVGCEEGDWSDWIESDKIIEYKHTFETEGIFTIRIRAEDEHGLGSGWQCHLDVIIEDDTQDTTPPVTTHSLKGENGNNEWYVSNVEVTLTAEDDMSGVDRIEYQEMNIDHFPEPYNGPFTITKEGKNTIIYWSTDKAGNKEEPKSADFQIDKTLPSTEYIIYGEKINENTYENSVKVELIANDDVSGVNFIMYRILNSEGDEDLKFSVYDKEFVVDEPGKNTVEFYSTDKAGNKEERKSFTIIIEDENQDVTPPVTTHLLSGNNGNNNWFRSGVIVKLIANDEESGVYRTYYKKDKCVKCMPQVYEKPFRISNEGIHTLSYYSIDKAGNEEENKEIEIKIDSKKPSTEYAIEGGELLKTWSANGIPVYIYRGEVRIILEASDSTSGVDNTSYAIDRGPFETYKNPFELEKGKYFIHYRSSDKAGNIEITKGFIIHIVEQEKPGEEPRGRR